MIEALDATVTTIAVGLIGILMVPLLMAVFRMIAGPGYADRFIALDMLTAIAVALAALTAVTSQRREFLDIAFGVALVGFLATCALASLLERRTGDD